MSAEDVVFHARQCIDTPFLHQGRQPHVGLDCAGLVVHAFRSAGLPVVDDSRYPRSPEPGRMREVLAKTFYTVRGDWQSGDVLYFRIVHDPQHLAIWTGTGIIHAYLGAGRVTETGLDRRWKERLVARYRHPGIDR